jgi:hypothetical protein
MKKLLLAVVFLLSAASGWAQQSECPPLCYYPPEHLSLTGGTLTGNVELRDPSQLAGESLTNPNLTGGASWTQTADFALAANAATYTHATGAGTFQQTSAAGAIPWAQAGVNGWFTLTYVVSAVTGAPVCTIPNTFAASAQTLSSVAGTYSVTFQAKLTAAVGDFQVSCTSGAAATITFDTLSLKQINGGGLTVAGRIRTGDGTLALPAIGPVSEPSTGIYFTDGRILFGVNAAAQWTMEGLQFYPSGTTDTTGLGVATKLITTGYFSRGFQGSKSKALTDAAAATAFVTVAVPTNGWVGGELIWTATSLSGADQLATQGAIRFAGATTGATPVCTVGVIGTDLAAVSGGANTLVCTWTNVVAAQTCAVSVTCSNNLAGTQAITLYGRADLPIAATLVFP